MALSSYFAAPFPRLPAEAFLEAVALLVFAAPPVPFAALAPFPAVGPAADFLLTFFRAKPSLTGAPLPHLHIGSAMDAADIPASFSSKHPSHSFAMDKLTGLQTVGIRGGDGAGRGRNPLRMEHGVTCPGCRIPLQV